MDFKPAGYRLTTQAASRMTHAGAKKRLGFLLLYTAFLDTTVSSRVVRGRYKTMWLNFPLTCRIESSCRPAAVDEQGLSGDERCGGRGEENDGSRYLYRLANSM